MSDAKVDVTSPPLVRLCREVCDPSLGSVECVEAQHCSFGLEPTSYGDWPRIGDTRR